MKKIITIGLILGLSSLASFACPCTGDKSPCKCGANCPKCSCSQGK